MAILESPDLTSHEPPPVGNFYKFNDWLGNPLNQAGFPVDGILDWHNDVRNRIWEHRHVIINKFTGAAMTEIIPRVMLEMILNDHDPAMKRLTQFAIITGIRTNLTLEIMESRIMPIIRRRQPHIIKQWLKSELKIEFVNGRYIQGYPTANVDAARGQDDLRFAFIDEAAFFPQTDQESVYNVFARYKLKTNPWLVWNSTPNGPAGSYYNIWRNSERGTNDYHRIELPWQLGIGSLLTQEQVDEERARNPRMFRQEYNLEFVQPEGAVMPDRLETDNVEEIRL